MMMMSVDGCEQWKSGTPPAVPEHQIAIDTEVLSKKSELVTVHDIHKPS